MTTTAQEQPQPQHVPVLRFKEGTTVVPGDRLGTIRQVRPGIGTYVKGGHIYASLLGRLALQQQQQTTETSLDELEREMMDTNTVGGGGGGDNDGDDGDRSKEETNNNNNSPQYACCIRASKPPATNQVLKVGQRVVGKISRITPQNAVVEIRVAEGVGPIRLPYYEGAIRLEDIRSFSSSSNNNTSSSSSNSNNNNKNSDENVVLEECFRPGDLVACRVISMGDARRYFLTTAETELGVIRAFASKQRKGHNKAGGGVPMIPVSWKEMECPETGIREPRKCAKPLVQ